jgi:hypothetical protein
MIEIRHQNGIVNHLHLTTVLESGSKVTSVMTSNSLVILT